MLVENLFPPIPSEVVLPLAGFLVGQGRLSLVAVVVAATAGSVLGARALYALGAWLGRDRLAHLLDRLPLTGPEDLERAEGWFARHGGKAVLLGRLVPVVPVVRSLVSIPAGVERMPVPRFVLYTASGSAAYNTVLVGGGYLLGSRWTDVGRYSETLSAAVVAAIAVGLLVLVVCRMRKPVS